MFINTRRSAANRVKSTDSTYASPTAGADRRRAILKRLTPSQKHQLELFKLEDGRTETNVYPAYACTLDYKAGKIAVETDTAPRLVVQSIIGIDQGPPDHFFIPLSVVDDDEWQETFPNFSQWLVGSSRFPRLDESSKKVLPNLNLPGNQIKKVSDLDELEVYFAALFGTLSEFFANGKTKYAENSWKLLWTLNKVVQQASPQKEMNMTELLQKTDRFKALIEARDKSVQNAVEYRTFVGELNPSHYYWMLYQLMLEAPEVVHKSHLSNLDTCILGLMTQPSLGEVGCTISGIEDSLLRMILERSMKWIPKQKVDRFMEKEELIEALHKAAGRGVESNLRYWAFMIETIRSVILGRFTGMSEFVSRVQIIRNNLLTMNGITPFCLLICPSVARYLSDEVIAEFIYTVGQADKKFTVLLTSILSTKASTPLLDEIISKNHKRVQKVQESISSEPAENAWAEVAAMSLNGHYHAPSTSFAYKSWIIRFARRGDEHSLRCLQKLISDSQTSSPAILGTRRTRLLILRAACRDSEVFAHYSEGLHPLVVEDIRLNIPRGHVGQMIRDANTDLPQVVESLFHEKSKYDATPIEFVKFELAREMVARIREKVVHELNAVPCECTICYDSFPGQRMITLHGDPRHQVCDSCRKHLSSCPFCRKNL